jgi:hypothetical protein
VPFEDIKQGGSVGRVTLPAALAIPMVFLDVGVGDGAAIGVGVDQQDLAARGGRLEGEVVTATVVRPGAPLGPQTAARTRRASPSAWDRDLVGRRRLVGVAGVAGQRRPGPVGLVSARADTPQGRFGTVPYL